MQVVDSLPIITCSGKRTPKVATEIVGKGYCSSKSLFYHGVKLHMLGSVMEGALPFPRSIFVSSASESDLNVYRDNWSLICNMVTLADKAYIDSAMQTQMKTVNYEILTPVKHPKGTCDVIKQMFASADKLYSAAVSRVRQPIESWFNWLIQKTDIQRASKIRSTNGLIVHIFNKINAALCNCFI